METFKGPGSRQYSKVSITNNRLGAFYGKVCNGILSLSHRKLSWAFVYIFHGKLGTTAENLFQILKEPLKIYRLKALNVNFNAKVSEIFLNTLFWTYVLQT